MELLDLVCFGLVCGAIGALTAHSQKRKRPARFQWSIGPAVNKPKDQPKKGRMLEITITNEQKIKVSLAPVTATGKPANLDGKPSWSVISGDSTVEVAEDGLSATLVSSDTPGDTQILVQADADLGEGVEEISDVIKLTVEGARAASLGLSIGQAEPK